MLIELTENDKKKIRWMDESVVDVPSNKILYRILCFFTGRRKRKLTYKELYVVYTHIYNFKKNDISEVKRKSMETLLEIYKKNNGYYPENVI
jgi:hypothetical protein